MSCRVCTGILPVQYALSGKCLTRKECASTVSLIVLHNILMDIRNTKKKKKRKKKEDVPLLTRAGFFKFPVRRQVRFEEIRRIELPWRICFLFGFQLLSGQI